MDLEEHLFRRESGRLVALVTRLFGIHNLALAEDVVQDAFCRALETWKFHGAPGNPAAWLLTAAKHRALDVLRREGTARRFAPDLGEALTSEWTLTPTVEDAFEAGGIDDVVLRMMFSCIHPKISEETQVALILHLLCGFGIDETAAAFLKNGDAMERKLRRAKETLAESRALFDLAGAADVAARLPGVLRALYLLFNEGYHGACAQSAVRAELCGEALRLIALLLQSARTSTPATHALAALLCFLAARLPGRIDVDGNLILLVDQDRSLWDARLIAEGRRHLELSAAGNELTTYHVEAAIAELHADAGRSEETDWNAIVSLYEMLMRIAPSPVVGLNRAVAVAQRDGPARGLEEIARIDDPDLLARYPFYFTAIGELELRLGHSLAARSAFESALAVGRNPNERRFLEGRLRECAT
jgi:RNA polymerase sigma-70 factor (ECF subfamily)